MIFAGVVGREIPAGVSQSAAVTHLRQSGQGTLANLVQSTPITHGIDFDHVGQILLQVLLVYLAASVASYFQARLTAMVGQRSVARLREKVQSKLTRLPLSYFDRQPHGEILSPRHERHRQHLPDAAADAQPDGYVAANHRRRARCDVHHLLAAGADRARHRTALDHRRHQDRKAGSAQLRGPVADDRAAERPYRGDVHAATRWSSCSAAATRRRRPSDSTTSRSTSRASRRSSSRG